MIRLIVLLICLLFSNQLLATVTCIGTPKQVYAGAHGPSPSEQSFWLLLDGDHQKYNLGLVSDDLAKARYSMVLSALHSSSSIVMQFYYLSSPSSCINAITDKATPSAMYIESK